MCIDLGIDTFIKLVDKSHFPWLLSNVFCAEEHKPLFNYHTKLIVELNGYKVILVDFFPFLGFFNWTFLFKIDWNYFISRKRMGLFDFVDPIR